eukprot:scpid53489/ scgid32319/ 
MLHCLKTTAGPFSSSGIHVYSTNHQTSPLPTSVLTATAQIRHGFQRPFYSSTSPWVIAMAHRHGSSPRLISKAHLHGSLPWAMAVGHIHGPFVRDIVSSHGSSPRGRRRSSLQVISMGYLYGTSVC